MKNQDDIQDKINIDESPNTEKKIWIAPNLRVLLHAQHIQGGDRGNAETNGGLWQS